MSEAIDELAQQADENETIKQMGTLDTVAMVITIAGDNGVYRVESDDRAEKCLRLLLTAMNQEGPLRMTKVAEIPPEIYEAVQAAREAAEEGTGCGECDGCKAAAAEQAPDPDETIH